MTEAKDHNIRILLAKLSEIFLNTSIGIQVIQLKNLQIL